MTEIRSGMWAELDGRTFPVRTRRKGVFQEWVPHGHLVRLVGPTYAAEDLDLLYVVRPSGVVAGHRFQLESAPGADVGIYDVLGPAPDEVRDLLGLTGNPYDGWRGRVPYADVEHVQEDVRVLHRRAVG